MTQRTLLGAAIVGSLAISGCGGDAPGSSATRESPSSAVPSLASDVRAAAEAIDAELGAPQRFFEITATGQLTNVFVAIEDATAAVAYLYIDGEVQPPAPRTSAEGQTFATDDIDFDDELILDRLADELPQTVIRQFSVYGDGFGATYVVAGQSSAGGLLDIVVTGDGAIVSVDPI